MSSSLLNWVNKRSKSNDECDNLSNKKLCVESEHILSNKESNKNIELHETSDLPECWNKGQYENFKTVNEWLVVKNKALGCLICKNITNLGLSVVDKTLRFSKPWQDCSIISNGNSKETQMSSLRKKIFEHKKSDAHLRAVELHKQSKEKQIEKSFENALKSKFSTTEKVFRTVYKIVKTQRPFVDVPNEIDL